MADTDYRTLLKMTAASKSLKAKQRKSAAVEAVAPVDTKNITQRLRGDGTPSYLVNLRLQREGAPWIYRQTFDTLAEAVAARNTARETFRAGAAAAAVPAQIPCHAETSNKQTVANIIALRLGRVDKRASPRPRGMIQAGICDGDQLGTRSYV